jgi:hypothetical protein
MQEDFMAGRELLPVAIDALCDMLNRFPGNRRADAITFACIAVGQSAQPTGLKPTWDRTMKQMFWDATTNDLRGRLIHLVEEVGVPQQTIVQGVIAYLDSHFSRAADREFSERARDNHVSAIANLQKQLELPGNANNAHVLAGIQFMEEALESCERRRQDAEEALLVFREETAKVFTNAFWEALAKEEIGDPRRLFDGLGEPPQE